MKLKDSDKIICNICKQSCYVDLNLRNDFGYGSSRDGEIHQSHICASCYDKHIFPLFQISPIVGNYLFEEDNYRHDLKDWEKENLSKKEFEK